MSIKDKIKIPKFLKNKYLILVVIVMFISIIFDRNNIINLISDVVKVHRQETEIQELHDAIKLQKIKLKELTSNKDSLEKFARETYFFHEKNEDVFLVK